VVDFTKSTFIDKFSDRLLVWIPPSNVRLTDSQHINSSLIKFDENSIVDLSESEKLQSFANLWVDLVDTTNSDDKCQLWFRWDIEISFITGLSAHADLVTLLLSVLLHVLFSPLEDFDSLVPSQTAVLRSSFQLQGL